MAIKEYGVSPGKGNEVARIQDVVHAPAYAGPDQLSHRFDWVHGDYNWEGAITRVLDQGTSSAAKNGQSHSLWIGDSAMAGITNNVNSPVQADRLSAIPLAMRDQMSNWGVPANGTGWVRTTDGGLIVDPRWTSAGTWLGQTTYAFSSTINSTATFFPDRPGSVLEVRYSNALTGTFTITVDGTLVATVTGAGAGSWVTKRVTGLAIVAGSVVVVKLTVAGTGIGLFGASVWSPNNGLIVDNVSQSGSKAGNTALTSWTDTSNAASPILIVKDMYRTRQVTDAATTVGVNTLTSATAAFTDNDINEPIDCLPNASGIPFPPGTYIVSRTSTTVVVCSNLANATLTNQTVGIGRDPSDVNIGLGANDMQAGRTATQIVTDIATIAANFPKSNIIIHLQEEVAYSLVSQATQNLFQAALYAACDTNNWALYDWRDRTGDYTTALANYTYGDYQAHLSRQAQANIGSAYAFLRGGGSGTPRFYSKPVDDGDGTNKAYVDGIQRFRTPLVSAVTIATTAETLGLQLALPPNQAGVATTVEFAAWGTITGTTPSLLAKIRAGTAGTASDGQVAATTNSTTITSTAGFEIRGVVTFRTLGASGSVFGQLRVSPDNVAQRVSGSTAAVTVDTTSKLFVTLFIVAGGTGPTVTINNGYVEKITT